MEDRFKTYWKRISDYTMVSVERAYALYQSLDYLNRNGIDGDFVECGVWRGGLCMLAGMMAREMENRPKIWLYDTFEGMTAPTDEDKIAVSGSPVSERNPKGWWSVSQKEVEKNLVSVGYDNWETVSGDVLQTLDGNRIPEKIALLRLDTDWYESTKKEMETLFPLLVPSGVLLIDDYGHFTGAAKAVDEYFEKIGIKPLLQRVDYTGRLYIKE